MAYLKKFEEQNSYTNEVKDQANLILAKKGFEIENRLLRGKDSSGQLIYDELQRST